MKKYNRRDFLKSSLVAGTSLMMLPSCATAGSNSTIGIQLYTLRDMMTDDPGQTLKKVAEIGYKDLELAGYSNRKFYGQSPSDFKDMVEDNDLKVVSGHYSKETMQKGWDQAIEDALAIDQQYMVLGYLQEQDREEIGDYYDLLDLLNTCGTKCKDAGIQFAYHNHDFEFTELSGEIPYEILLSETDPGNVKMELDLYWATKAGYDPIELFEKDKGRFVLWHVKDLDDDGNFTEVGSGNINFKSIFEHQNTSGMEHFFIEQDKIEGDKWTSIEKSYRHIKGIV